MLKKDMLKCQFCDSDCVAWRCEECRRTMGSLHVNDGHRSPRQPGQEERIAIYQRAAENRMPLFSGVVARLIQRLNARLVAAVLLLLCAGPVAAEDNATLLRSTGVELPKLDWYKARRVSQHLSIVNGQHVTAPVDATHGADNPNAKIIWAAPGGLFWSPREQWRNATAVHLPGPVYVYKTMTQVKNSGGFMQNNAVVRWTFPDGTVFVDLLIRRDGEREWPFEVRVREKRGGKWEATAHRPDVPADSVRWVQPVPALDEHLPARTLEMWLLKSRPVGKFKPTREAYREHPDKPSFLPKHYIGNMVNCNSCHSRSGESGNYSGANAPGADETISWHPFRTDVDLNRYAEPAFDTKRWPLTIETRFIGPQSDTFGRAVPGLRHTANYLDTRDENENPPRKEEPLLDLLVMLIQWGMRACGLK